MESISLTLSGKSSILEAQYYPPIQLSPHKNYALGLVNLLTFNSIPNISVGNNKLYIGDQQIVLPTSSYEISDIEAFIQKALKRRNINVGVFIKPNLNTLHSEITTTAEIDFRPLASIAYLLGFWHRVLPPNNKHISDFPVNILKVNSLRVECSITTGAYINDRKVHTIHEFFRSSLQDSRSSKFHSR